MYSERRRCLIEYYHYHLPITLLLLLLLPHHRRSAVGCFKSTGRNNALTVSFKTPKAVCQTKKKTYIYISYTRPHTLERFSRFPVDDRRRLRRRVRYRNTGRGGLHTEQQTLRRL